jgi:hypothetical protein
LYCELFHCKLQSFCTEGVPEKNLIVTVDFANTWAPGLNLTSPDSWHAPLLQALSASHALLLQDYGFVEWTSASDQVPVPLAVSIAHPFVQPSVGSRNSLPPLSTVTLPQLCMLFQSTHEDRHGAEALAEPGERIVKSPLKRTLTAHIVGPSMRVPSHTSVCSGRLRCWR